MKKKLAMLIFACSTLLVAEITSPSSILATMNKEGNSSTFVLNEVMIPEITKYNLGDDIIGGKSEPNVGIILFTWDGIPVTRIVQSDANGNFETTLLESFYNGHPLKVLDVTHSVYSGLFYPTSF